MQGYDTEHYKICLNRKEGKPAERESELKWQKKSFSKEKRR